MDWVASCATSPGSPCFLYNFEIAPVESPETEVKVLVRTELPIPISSPSATSPILFEQSCTTSCNEAGSRSMTTRSMLERIVLISRRDLVLAMREKAVTRKE